MPNRLERINGNLVWKNQAGSVQKDSIQTLPDYSKNDDFGYATDAQVDLIYAAQTADTLSYVATGTKDLSGTTAGQTAGFITLGAGNFVDPTKKLTFKARVQLTDDDEELFAYIGCAQTTPTAADPPVEGDDAVCFKLTEVVSDVNWQCITATDLGTTETIVDSGIVVDLLAHDFEIVIDNAEATFKIDGVIVASIRTNLPVTTALVPQIKVTTGDTDAKGIIADVLSVVNSRS